jgi:hypothetical protein
MSESLKIQQKPSSQQPMPKIDNIALIFSFLLVLWAVYGQFEYGTSWVLYIPLFIIPIVHLIRFKDLDPLSFPFNQKVSFFSFEKIYPILVLIFTFLAVPYFLALMGILPQNTIIHNIYTGELAHTGIHHGWVAWYFLVEAYFYHRINRHASKNKIAGQLWRNGLLIFGLFLFFDDYWEEEITAGILGWPSPFLAINQVFQHSWNVNFAIELGILFLIVIVSYFFYYKLHKN